MPFPNSQLARTRPFTDIRPIGQGSGGQVYAARDNIGRTIAIKEALPSAQHAHERRARFEQEARIQGTFNHPNILTVYTLEADLQTQELYLLCEYANGGSLADRLQSHGPLTEDEAIIVVLDICAALEATSARQIIHRDVKPGNILLITDAQGQITGAKLGDFGIARDNTRRYTTAVPGNAHAGTWQYMAPEQNDITKPVDVRSDLYALGITLWEVLTGEDYKVLQAQKGDTPALHIYQASASPKIALIIQRAVQEDPKQRYQTPQAMASDLHALSNRKFTARSTIHVSTPIGHNIPVPTPQRTRSRLVPTLLVLIGLGVFVSSFALLGARFGFGTAGNPTSTAVVSGTETAEASLLITSTSNTTTDTVTPVAKAAETRCVTNGLAKMRSDRLIAAEDNVLDTFQKDTSFPFLGKTGNWVQVQEHPDGWIHASLLNCGDLSVLATTSGVPDSVAPAANILSTSTPDSVAPAANILSTSTPESLIPTNEPVPTSIPEPISTETPIIPLSTSTSTPIQPTDTPTLTPIIPTITLPAPPPVSQFKLSGNSIWHPFFCVANDQCAVGDFNGDHRDDIITFIKSGSGANSVVVAISTGGGFEPQPNAPVWHNLFCIDKDICTVGDFDGDGMDDIIKFVRTPLSVGTSAGGGGSLMEVGDVWVALSNGSGFGEAKKWHDFFCVDKEVCKIGDFNGDGKDDIITFMRSASSGARLGDVLVATSDGTHFFPSPVADVWHEDFCEGNEVCEIGDFNGDGRDDIIGFNHSASSGKVFVSLSEVTRFARPFVWHDFFCVEKEVCKIGDFNGDGMDDIITFMRSADDGERKGDVLVATSDGTRFLPSPRADIWHTFFCIGQEVCDIGDFNGDQRTDIVLFKREADPEPSRGDVIVALSVVE